VDCFPLTLAGVPFEIFPVSALSPEDRQLLLELQRSSPLRAPGSRRALKVELLREMPWPEQRPHEHADATAASVEPEGALLWVRHRRYIARVDLGDETVRLWRAEPHAGLLATLRVALCARLPGLGGLPLHAAGIVAAGQGLVFFGPSGAGKSTLAATSPTGALSDELVAVCGPPWRLVATGLWGALSGATQTPEAPLTALVELAKGPTFQLERLAHREGLRRLLGGMLVPPSPALWQVALEVVGRLLQAVPVYRMHWTPSQPPWPLLADALARRAD
jgi:hypothetical protein